MTDISVRKTSNTGKANHSGKENKYLKLKKAYDEFIEKYKKSDFANSPTLVAKELELLAELKTAAEENNQTDTKWIEERIEKLKSYIETDRQNLPSAYYTSIAESHVGKSASSTSNIQKITDAFNDYEPNEYLLDYIINKFKDESGNIPEDKVEAMIVLAESGVAMSFIPQILEDFKVITPKIENKDSKPDNTAGISEQTDIEACKQIAEFKNTGLDDFSAIKFTKFLNGKSVNQNILKTSLIKLFQAGISLDACIQIIQLLTVYNEKDNTIKISPNAIKSVISIKNSLVLTRKNEKRERENPINQIGVSRFQFGDTILIMKDQKVTYITPTEGETVNSTRKEYNELISKIEDAMLTEFITKYKNSEGEIDSKYLRLTTALRRSGICYDQLFPMIDFCIDDKGNIDKQKLAAIESLKNAGALSKDIRDIISALEVSENGEYSTEDIKNACDLSKAVIGGKEVCKLLPEVREQESAKEFFVFLSYLIDKKSILLDMLPLIKDNEGKYDENAMGLLMSLATRLYNHQNNQTNEKMFTEYAKLLIEAAKDRNENKVSDAASEMGIFMRNYKDIGDFIKILDLCKDKNGKLDEKLSKTIPNISIFVPDLSEMKTLIDFCKNPDGEINYTKLDKLIEVFEQTYDRKQLLNFVANYTD